MIGLQGFEEHDHIATQTEAEREWVTNVSHDRADQAWLLSDRDVWYANPAYQGPPVPHPEDENV